MLSFKDAVVWKSINSYRSDPSCQCFSLSTNSFLPPSPALATLSICFAFLTRFFVFPKKATSKEKEDSKKTKNANFNFLTKAKNRRRRRRALRVLLRPPGPGGARRSGGSRTRLEPRVRPRAERPSFEFAATSAPPLCSPVPTRGEDRAARAVGAGRGLPAGFRAPPRVPEDRRRPGRSRRPPRLAKIYPLAPDSPT